MMRDNMTELPGGVESTPLDVLMGIMFFPRGGSAFVTRELVRHLPAHGIAVTLLSGSRSDVGGLGDARRFYSRCNVRAIDLTSDLEAVACAVNHGQGRTAPMHPSYEQTEAPAESWFGGLDNDTYQRHVDAWARCFAECAPSSVDLAYLHHLTPMHESVGITHPGVPIVSHLHGTELLMMEQLQGGGTRSLHSLEWLRRMRRWARNSDRLIVAPGNVARASAAVELEAARFTVQPNGYDPTRFFPRSVDRRGVWRRVLVAKPGGSPRTPPGRLRYTPDDVERLMLSIIMVYVGRFTRVKRLPFMLEAFKEASQISAREVSLVVVGGYPGEWQDEHPVAVAARLAVDNVYFAGWRDHDTLPDVLAASDVLVLASERESFGQVVVEAMGCGVPAIVGDGFGPSTIVDGTSTGWLYELDSRRDLSRAMVTAALDPAELARRGRLAAIEARRRFAWAGITKDLSEVPRQIDAEARPDAGREETG